MIPSSGGLDEELLEKIKKEYPEFRFVLGRKFMFKTPKTIVVRLDEARGDLLLLHELSHALLGHRDYKTDVRRLKMEVEAWEKAKELAPLFKIEVDEDFIENELDTYRDWLHKKSRCPKCGLTRFQTQNGQYHCPKCDLLE